MSNQTATPRRNRLDLLREIETLKGERDAALRNASEIKGVLSERERAEARAERLLLLLGELTDPDPCWFDHKGYCQAHTWLRSDECPHARAKRELSADDGAADAAGDGGKT